MKILVTGAHFTPAVATIEELEKVKEVEIIYAGRRTTLEGDDSLSAESKELTSLGIKFIPIITGRLQRSFSIYTILSLLKIPVGALQALYIILSQHPDVILSFGGYVAVPIVIIGWLFSIPIIIHEQTLVPGLANKISSFFADKIAVSFEKSWYNPEKVILTGNPIRREIVEISKGVKLAHPKGGFVILVTGGNQGSHVINQAVEGCLDQLTKTAFVIHITGDSKFDDFERLRKLREPGERYKVRKWIGKEYGEVLQKADLVVCRAGINTLMELAVLGKPALVIPIPNKEQEGNAKYFEELGLIRQLPQSKLSPEKLLKEINFMLKDLPASQGDAWEAKKIIIPDGAKRLALETIILAE